MSFDTRLLDKYNIPHFDGHVQLDLWALTNSYMIIDNSIWNQIGQRAIAYSPQYGAGWSTWNDNVISPIDAETNMILLCMGEDKNAHEFEAIFKHVKNLSPRQPLNLQGIDTVTIEWSNISHGAFHISEYDGAEKIEFQNDPNITWM